MLQWGVGRGAASHSDSDRAIPPNMKEPAMENVEIEVEGDTLILKVNLTKDLGLSKSEKTRTVATSRGNVKIPGTDATFGLNVWRKP